MPVLAQCGPVNLQVVRIERGLRCRNGQRVLRRNGAPFARDLRSNALRQLAYRTIVDEHAVSDWPSMSINPGATTKPFARSRASQFRRNFSYRRRCGHR